MSARRSTLLTVTLALVLSGVLSPVVTAHAASPTTYTWVGNSLTPNADNHSSTDSRNWSPGGVPGDGDSVIIQQPSNNDCFAHVDAVPTVTLAGFTLAEDPTLCTTSVSGGAISVTGTFSWDGGKLDTPTTIEPGATGTISGGNQRTNGLAQDLEVGGDLTLTGTTGSGALQILHGKRLHVENGTTLLSSGANEITGSACCTDPAKVVNDGTVSVTGGTLTVAAAELDQLAAVSVSAGAELVTTDAPVTTGATGTYTGTGRWLLQTRAAARFSGTQTLGSGFHLEFGGLASVFSSSLGGSATLAGHGTFDWTGGVIEAQLTFAHGLTVHVAGAHSGGAQRVLQGHDFSAGGAGVPVTLTNHATVTLSGGATVATGGQARLVNAADGVLALAPGTGLSAQGCCSAPDRVTNAGTVHVLAATGSASASLSLLSYRSTGTTAIAAGHALQLAGGARGSLAGGSVTGGGRLVVATPMTVSGTVSIGSNTTLALAGHGSLDGTATIAGAGSTAWTGGALSGALTVGTAGGIAVSGPAPKAVATVNGGSTPSAVTFTGPTRLAAGTSAAHDVVALGVSKLVLGAATTAGAYVEFAGGTLVNRGALSIHAGRVLVSTFQQSSAGRLNLDVSATRNGVLQVAGTASLHGKVAARNLAAPALGRRVTAVTASALTDSLTCVRSTGAGSASRHWADAHTATRLVLVWRRGVAHC